MNFYKLIFNGNIVDVTDHPVWVKPNCRGRIIRCGVHEACGIVDRDEEKVWQIVGARPLPGDHDKICVADITADEYAELQTILDLGGTITDQSMEIEWSIEPELVEEQNYDLSNAIERKIQVLSNACQAAIMAGIDVVLSDDNIKHFNLTIEDQINLMFAKEAVAVGAEHVLFKAAGEPLCYYSPADIVMIIEKCMEHIVAQRAYFESLKRWVSDAKTIAEVGDHYYGEEIPENYWSDIYRTKKS